MNPPVLDAIIVGQGLAGSLLAWQLLAQHQNILVIDNQHATGCSRTAAGLINPITGKRLARPALLEQYLEDADSLYSSLEEFFGQTFFHPRNITRLFQSEQEQQYFDKRQQDKSYQAYLGEPFDDNNPRLQQPAQGFSIKQGGYLDTVSLLDCLSEYLSLHNCLHQSQLDYDDIHIDSNNIEVNGFNTRRLIFCEGYKATDNPWFSWLPFKPAKGEILTLKSDSKVSDSLINNGRWLLPTTAGHYRFGSTYQWDQLDNQPSAQGREQLLTSLQDMIKDSDTMQVTEHLAAVRPCTSDTEPFIGMHPQSTMIGIFNGFGSKGALLIPYFSNQFCQHIINNTPIDTTANIQRYPHE